MSPVTSSRNC